MSHVTSTAGLTKVSAVAGSGKTTLLTQIEKAVNPTNAIYICYNKSIATEASQKFSKATNCCTTHSLAFKYTVKPYKLQIGSFSHRSITEHIRYELKREIVDYIREFCLSSHVSFADFAADIGIENLSMITVCNKYLNQMQLAQIECTHEFYLKLFHILLAAGNLKFDELDLLMLDEAGDLNAVTLEIFNLIPAKRKLMVGDPNQNIYTFNHTINAFKVMANEGTLLPMSQSFRVSEDIAERIQRFCRNSLDPDFHFVGVPTTDKSINSRMYISRTNAGLIGKMIELNELEIPYKLTRTAKQIFDLPLTLCNLSPKTFISNPEFAYLKDDIAVFYADSELMKEYRSPLMYIKAVHSDEIAIQTAISIILAYGKSEIMNCYEEARKHERGSHSYILGTSHSTKGLEADEVTIANDLNDSIAELYQNLCDSHVSINDLTVGERTSLNLYYTACSRARISLINARHL